MNEQGYNTLADWKLDMEYMRAHPKDQVFFNHVVKRINSSTQKLRMEVQDYLSGIALERNPWMVFQQVIKENPKFALIANGADDPWFKA